MRMNDKNQTELDDFIEIEDKVLDNDLKLESVDKTYKEYNKINKNDNTYNSMNDYILDKSNNNQKSIRNEINSSDMKYPSPHHNLSENENVWKLDDNEDNYQFDNI